MADSRWERVEELYHAALERDSSERIAFLQAACAGDESLRQEVESLLAEETEEEFLGIPALEVAARELASPGGALIGRQFGPYRIHSLLGAGGMGEVYRAHDTKLLREVAIKVLPAVVAHDADRVGRFAREARLLASLNHPHIAAIHGIEEAEGVSALVLELVEGETLADRLARGPLAVAESIAIAKQIADGLEAAHESGIVHCDLKPSNIKVRPDGNVKILDFGLAKALAPTGDALHASTASRGGMVTGTPAYMSPEQARGQAVDRRTDIWAFGCVLYEMLTGNQAFAGQTVTETLGAVMTAEPAWEALPGELSPTLRAFLRRCLFKDARQRVGDIHDVRLALDDAFEIGVPVTAAASPRWRRSVAALGAALALVLVTGLVAWTVMRGRTSAPAVSRLSMEVPILALDNVAPVLDVSPEGTHIVYAANGSLWLRRLDALQPWVVSGTEASNAHTPAFSPDGQWIAFYDQSSRQLKRVAIGGGLPVVVAAIDPPFGVAWPTDDLLLYGRGRDGIWQVALPGGTPERVIAMVDGDEAQSPQLLPNGKVLFTLRPRESSTWQDARVVAQAPGAEKPTVVIARGHAARYLPSGHLLYSSSSDVLAAPFDLDSSRIQKDPVSVVSDVRIASLSYTDSAQYAVSRNGMLVYLPRSPVPNTPLSLVWVTRDGREEPLNLALRSNGWVRVAPDGMRIAHGGGAGVFISDIARPAWIPIANTPGGLQIGDTTGGWYPVWSHDSRSLIFFASRKGTVTLVRTRVDASGAKEERPVRANAAGGSGERFSLAGNQLVVAGALTPDDRELVFTHGTQIAPHFGLLKLNSVGRDPLSWKPIDRLQDMSAANLSPRGDWIAYHSWHDSGQFQVWIARFPALDQPKPISTEVGTSQPRWSADGTELFYRRADGAMMAVKIQTTPTFHIADPIQLFESRGYGLGSLPARGGARDWDVAKDGRFLMIKNASPSATPNSIVVVQNWTEELKRLVPVR